MKGCLVILPAVVACACASCSRSGDSRAGSDEAQPPILATIGEERITLVEFETELARRSRGQPWAFASAEEQNALIEEMVRAKAALAKARASGFDRDPQTIALVERVIVARFQEQELARNASRQEPGVTDEAIESYYANNQPQFRRPAAARAGVIRLKVSSKAEPAARDAIRRRAESLRERAAEADEPAFRLLVQQHSDDQSTRYTGGDTGWLREDEPSLHWEEAVVTAAFSLQSAGEVAKLVETPNAFYIVRLTARETPSTASLEEVRDTIRYQLAHANRVRREQAFFDDLKRGLKIEINRELLQTLPPRAPPLSQKPPPALPGS